MPIALGLLHTFRVGSVYVTLSVTFERFHAIICPLRQFRWKKYLLTMSVVFSLIYNIPKYFEMKVEVFFTFNRNKLLMKINLHLFQDLKFFQRPLFMRE